jgi:four helix bundle protein
MAIACRECRETRLWLRLIKESQIVDVNVDSELKESNEILNILYRIIKTSQENLQHQINSKKQISKRSS